MGALEDGLAIALRPIAEQLARIEERLVFLDEVLAEAVAQPERLWSSAQVASKCNVTPSAVRVWHHRGQIATVKSGRRVLVPDWQLRELLANGGRPRRAS